MAITVEDVLWLYHNTESWTRSERQFRMSRATWDILILDYRWEPPYDTIYGRPVVVDDSVPEGTIDFAIPVPEPPGGLA